MSDRAMSHTLRGMAVLGVVIALAGFVAVLLVEGSAGLLRGGAPIGFAMVLVFFMVVWIAAPNQPRNALLWVLAVFVVAIATVPGAEAIVAANAPDLERPLDISLVPAALPPVVALTTGWSYTVQTLGFYGLLTFGLLLFPDGRLPSPRWRPFAFVLAMGVAFLSLSQLLSWLPHQTVAPNDNPLFSMTAPVVLLGPPTSLVGLVMRYRRSESDARARIKWIMWGATLMVPATLIGIVEGAELLTLGGLLALAAGYGIAIVRHRLLDVDLIISKTLVYGSLAVFIGVVYVGVVVGIGSLVGSGDEPSAVLSVGATALVAVGFQPVRRRLERVANRVVFGRKATPYEVLSEFSRRVAATSDDLLDDAARSLAEGTRAERVVVSVMVDDDPVEAAAWPREQPVVAANPVSFPITDGDATLGSLDVFLPAGQQLQDDDRRLAEQLASGMGLALRNQLLTERLEARVGELRESRRRLVAVQDETRRRLERDLHDGAQQQLVALKVKLGLGRAIAEKDGASRTAELLDRLSGQADQAVDAMREFARGVYPPLLEAEGLASAITAQGRRTSIPVTVTSTGIGRYPREIESTVYFCVLEALRNTVQHSGASQATVTLNHSNGSLQFQVTDNGTGFDPDGAHGVGLTAMADRLDALTGDLTIHTQPGNGTTLTGTIPVPAEVPA